MNSSQLGITVASVFVVSAVSAVIFNLLNKERKPSIEYPEYRPSYEQRIPNYDADQRVEFKMEDEFEGYDADRKARDPKQIGGTRCVNCHTRLRYTRRK